jgi:AraC-like DNA-binding protein
VVASYWTTTDLAVVEQFSYWREVLCEAFTALAPARTATHRATGPDQPGISSWVKSSPLNALNCAEISSRTQLIAHGRDEVRRADTDVMFVNLQLTGQCVANQNGRTCVVPTGGYALFDTTSEYRLEYIEDPDTHQWRVLSFRIPRTSLLPLLAAPHDSTAVTHDANTGGMPAIVASTMIAVWNNIERLDQPAEDAADSAFLTMLAASAGPSTHTTPHTKQTLDDTTRAAINRYLAANLHGTDLSAARVARRFGLSIRKLHQLYENTEHSYAKTVMAFRVEACARELTTGHHNLTLTDLATRWGFCDLSHMNRIFRTHRGCLPSDLRHPTPTQQIAS